MNPSTAKDHVLISIKENIRMNSFKGIVALPLHVWDRELDSRILLAALAAIKNNLVILGHEYNMSPIYNTKNKIFHIGAGRPIYDRLRTQVWYRSIINNGGYVGLIFEEGVNDIERKGRKYLGPEDKINKESIATTSCIYAWNKTEKEIVVNEMCPEELRAELEKKFKIVGNTRIELCGPIGQRYFQKQIESIRRIFGEYHLASDNMVPVRFGQIPTKENKKLNLARDFANFLSNVCDIEQKENIILRPHPQSSKKLWDVWVQERRNLIVIGGGSVLPWIHGSKLVLHSGCTIGMEAILAGKKTMDISKIINDNRELGQSYKMCTYKPKTLEEAATLIGSQRSDDSSLSRTLDNYETYTLLDINMKLVNTEIASKYTSESQRFEKISSLKEIMKDLDQFSDSKEKNINEKIYDEFQNAIKKYEPNPEKSKYYSEQEIQERLKWACNALNIKDKVEAKLIGDSNVFFIKKA